MPILLSKAIQNLPFLPLQITVLRAVSTLSRIVYDIFTKLSARLRPMSYIAIKSFYKFGHAWSILASK